MIVLSFPDDADKGRKLAESINAENICIEYKIFPDGEDYVRIPVNLSNVENVVVFSSLYPDQDRKIFRTILLVDLLNDFNVKNIIIVFPYLAYSRQDRRFRDGESVSLKTLIRIFEKFNVNSIVTVDVHKPQAFTSEKVKCINVEPFEKYADYIRKNIKTDNLVILSPDFGSLWRAEKVAKYLNVNYDYFEKYRDRVTGQITMKPREVDVKDRDVVIIDDIIATGGTIREATRILRSMNARSIHVIATHCQFLNNADKKLLESGVSSIICSDTINTDYSKISVLDLIGNQIRKLIQDNV